MLGKRSVTADTALRLKRYFGMSPPFWLGLQMDYDLDIAASGQKKRLEKEVEPRASVAYHLAPTSLRPDGCWRCDLACVVGKQDTFERGERGTGKARF
jgi:hypothetical protein